MLSTTKKRRNGLTSFSLLPKPFQSLIEFWQQIEVNGRRENVQALSALWQGEILGIQSNPLEEMGSGRLMEVVP